MSFIYRPNRQRIAQLEAAIAKRAEKHPDDIEPWTEEEEAKWAVYRDMVAAAKKELDKELKTWEQHGSLGAEPQLYIVPRPITGSSSGGGGGGSSGSLNAATPTSNTQQKLEVEKSTVEEKKDSSRATSDVEEDYVLISDAPSGNDLDDDWDFVKDADRTNGDVPSVPNGKVQEKTLEEKEDEKKGRLC